MGGQALPRPRAVSRHRGQRSHLSHGGFSLRQSPALFRRPVLSRGHRAARSRDSGGDRARRSHGPGIHAGDPAWSGGVCRRTGRRAVLLRDGARLPHRPAHSATQSQRCAASQPAAVRAARSGARAFPRCRREFRLAALDRVKEEIAYLRIWQGIFTVSGISLAGWLLSAGDLAPTLSYGLALGGVLLLGLSSLILHREIASRIRRMETL